MSKVKFLVSYDGTDFCGWQRQNHGPLKGVQQIVQEAIEKVLDEKITLFASGRTDAGVHAFGQVCHFKSKKPADLLEKRDLCWSFNSQLPNSIRVKKAWLAPEEFHATISASHKTYRYLILNDPQKSVFLNRYADWIRKPIDLTYLREVSQILIGEHDFKSFQSVGTPVKDTVRKIFKAHWEWRKPNLLQFSITGDGFLKQMVRNIVGTQLMLEKRQEKPKKFSNIIDLADRSKAGPPAPPQGLYLWKVYYPKELDNKCREL